MRPSCLVFGLALAIANPALAGSSLCVETWGTDNPACGASATPCATIGQAVMNAAPNNTIIVGPGRYPGDIDLDKEKLKLESTAGARATVLVGGTNEVVLISADQVRFGKERKGFTVTASSSAGVRVSGGADGVNIAGIRAIENDGVGFNIRGTNHDLTANEARDNGDGAGNDHGFLLDGSGHVLEDNVSTGNGASGFHNNSDGTTLTHNLARGNDNGDGFNETGSETFSTNSYRHNVADDNDGHGFFIGGHRVAFKGNIATQNGGDGFRVLGLARSHVFEENLAIGNAVTGFFEENGPRGVLKYVGNVAEGNGLDGYYILTEDADGTSGVLFRKNSAYNNARCGLVNDSGGVLTTFKTWWGTTVPQGVKPIMPGFEFCNGAFAITVPNPATSPHPVKVKGGGL